MKVLAVAALQVTCNDTAVKVVVSFSFGIRFTQSTQTHYVKTMFSSLIHVILLVCSNEINVCVCVYTVRQITLFSITCFLVTCFSNNPKSRNKLKTIKQR
jgi:hypothetical protein